MQNIGKADPYYPGRQQSDTVAVLVLLAGAEQHFTIPTAASVAVISCTTSFYVLVNGQTAAVPGATNTAFPFPNTNPELSPSVLSVTPGNLFSAVASVNCVLTVSFYRDNEHLGPF